VLRGVHHRAVVDRLTDERVVAPGHRRLVGPIDEQVVDPDQEVVPRRAGHRPRTRQRFVRLEDLLDHGPAPAGRLRQPVEVPRRVAEPVDVVDPQPVDRAVAHQLDDQLVRRREHLGSSTRTPTSVSMLKKRR
jgi:hypothetical protein